MTYEYQCNDCGAEFEVKATIAEKSRGLRPTCPNCGSSKATQVYTSVNVLTGTRGGNVAPPFCGPGSGAGCC